MNFNISIKAESADSCRRFFSTKIYQSPPAAIFSFTLSLDFSVHISRTSPIVSSYRIESPKNISNGFSHSSVFIGISSVSAAYYPKLRATIRSFFNFYWKILSGLLKNRTKPYSTYGLPCFSLLLPCLSFIIYG